MLFLFYVHTSLYTLIFFVFSDELLHASRSSNQIMQLQNFVIKKKKAIVLFITVSMANTLYQKCDVCVCVCVCV